MLIELLRCVPINTHLLSSASCARLCFKQPAASHSGRTQSGDTHHACVTPWTVWGERVAPGLTALWTAEEALRWEEEHLLLG